MREQEEVERTVKQDKKFFCDKCGMEIDCIENWDEMGEVVSLSVRGGYGSKTIGDGNTLEVELCQFCFYNLLKPYSKITETQYDNVLEDNRYFSKNNNEI